MKHLLVWLAFFASYGICAFLFMRWLANKRIAGLKEPAAFNIHIQIVAFLGVMLIAVLPMSVEVAMRLFLKWSQYEGIGFSGFALLWVLSFVPGVLISRRTLKAGGINPDAES